MKNAGVGPDETRIDAGSTQFTMNLWRRERKEGKKGKKRKQGKEERRKRGKKERKKES